MQNLGIIRDQNNQYSIISKIYGGDDRKYYSARNEQNQINYIIAIKRNDYHDKNNDFPANEINILNILHNVNNPYILHFIRNGNGQLNLQDGKSKNVAYLVFENANINFSLTVCLKNGGLQERHAKLIFKKILNGIQAIHNANIYHRGINPGNIIFDNNYNPKIYSFDFSCLNANDLQNTKCERQFAPPELFADKPYNGIMYDIFSLGQLLFCLVTGIFGFNSSQKNDEYYSQIMKKNYVAYWKLILQHTPEPSESFKRLFLKMVAFHPEERPSIDDILNDEWMQEINNLNAGDMDILENEVRQELQNRRNNHN